MATQEQIEQWFKDCSDEFLKHDKVDPSQRMHVRDDLAAFLLISERVPVNGHSDIVVSASHDEIWLSGPDYGEEWNFTKEDVLLLARLGVRFDDGFCMYV